MDERFIDESFGKENCDEARKKKQETADISVVGILLVGMCAGSASESCDHHGCVHNS